MHKLRTVPGVMPALMAVALLLGPILVGPIFGSGAAQAAQPVQEREPSGGAMVADALVARPLLALATVGGAAVFLVSLPFSALGGNVDDAARTLVVAPAEATFRRCLGCRISKRRDEL
ncbi:hypothetical protein SAMN05216571_1171 [Onishia taeanensis]|uniref:Multidrug transporter n=1 Tax=Onishia taeanensis TaxID=284577 RepID=A0A1G7UVT2_9GAMM|nr:hypothetical protein [Halomonas taeanensis]SDG51418.1 hypothetical protein SAMN05216571_1171 [Halomonas taeanensis]